MRLKVLSIPAELTKTYILDISKLPSVPPKAMNRPGT